MPDALDTDKPERKAMSQESEVTKCPICGEADGYSHLDCNTRMQNAIRSTLASAPPAEARLREAVIEECAKVCDWYAHELVESSYTDERHGLDRIADEERAQAEIVKHAAQKIRALRSSPAASEPSKGARETPALDEFLSSRCVHDNEDAREAARAELSALKSAAPERPAMAVEACAKELAACAAETDAMRALKAKDFEAILARHFTPAAASPTVKMPERGVLARLFLEEWERHGFNEYALDDIAITEFARLNPPASPQDGKERA